MNAFFEESKAESIKLFRLSIQQNNRWDGSSRFESCIYISLAQSIQLYCSEYPFDLSGLVSNSISESFKQDWLLSNRFWKGIRACNEAQ